MAVLAAMSLMGSIGTGIARSSQADHFTFTVFDFPGATQGRTDAHGINAAGQIVGNYESGGQTCGGFARRGAGAQTHGYVRSAGGAFTTFDVPGADEIEPEGINDAGQIVGTFSDAKGHHGFMRSASGILTRIDVPGATETFAEGINASGKIVGYSYRESGDYGERGYVRSPSGVFTMIDAPGKRNTRAYGINSAAQIVGTFDMSGPGEYSPPHGWVRSAAGAFTTIDSPGSIGTFAYGINDGGQIVGEDIVVSDETYRGYLAMRMTNNY